MDTGLMKQAKIPVLSHLADIQGWGGDAINRYWGGSRPLSNMLAGGLSGAGLGYGLGWLGEKLLPEEYFEKGKLRRTLGLLGGALGGLPGAYHAYDALSQGRGLKGLIERWPQPAPDAQREAIDNLMQQTDFDSPAVQKSAEWSLAGLAGFEPTIAKDEFNRVVWSDTLTPRYVQSATSGLLEAASQSRGDMPFISPVDIARIGVGMGSGVASGLIVGKTLGALAGLRPEAQKSLQRVGAWAGILTSVVPMAFGR